MPAAPAIAAWAAVAGAAISGYSAYQSGQSQKKASKYNADMAEMKALDASHRGATEAAAKRDHARKIGASQAANMAASGVRIDSGTPLSLLTETAGLGQLDALTSLNNAQREAWGYGGQATLDRYQGKAAARAGVLNSAGTMLGGASKAYYGYQAAK
jgi:hypothetical protein